MHQRRSAAAESSQRPGHHRRLQHTTTTTAAADANVNVGAAHQTNNTNGDPRLPAPAAAGPPHPATNPTPQLAVPPGGIRLPLSPTYGDQHQLQPTTFLPNSQPSVRMPYAPPPPLPQPPTPSASWPLTSPEHAFPPPAFSPSWSFGPGGADAELDGNAAAVAMGGLGPRRALSRASEEAPSDSSVARFAHSASDRSLTPPSTGAANLEMSAAIAQWRESTPCAVLKTPDELRAVAHAAIIELAARDAAVTAPADAGASLEAWLDAHDAKAAERWARRRRGPPRSCRLVLMGVHHELTAFDVRLLLLALCPSAQVAQLQPDFQRDRATGAPRRGSDGQPRRSGLWRAWLGSDDQVTEAAAAIEGAVYTDAGNLVYFASPHMQAGREAGVQSLSELESMLLAWRNAALGGTGRPASLVRVEREESRRSPTNNQNRGQPSR